MSTTKRTKQASDAEASLNNTGTGSIEIDYDAIASAVTAAALDNLDMSAIAAMAGGTPSTKSLPIARVKRRKTTIPAVNKQDDNNQTTIMNALQIVQNQTILNATQMNTNLQQLSNEIDQIYKHDDDSQSIKGWRKDLRLLATNIDVTIQKYKERKIQNTLVEEGDHIKNNSWCPQLDAYVYDPHVRGKATFYDKCKCTNFRCPRSEDDGALFPATARPLGDEALIVLLGNKEVMKEDSLLRMRNNYLCAKVDNQIRQLYLCFKSESTSLNRNIPAFMAYEDSDEDSSEEEEDNPIQGAVNVSLSEGEEDGRNEDGEIGDVLDVEGINVDMEADVEAVANLDAEAIMDSAIAPPGYEGYIISSSMGLANQNDDNAQDESSDEEDNESESSSSSSEEEEDSSNGIEIDDTIPERLEVLLSKLSNEDLLHHMAAYNLDLRKVIADANAFIGTMSLNFYAIVGEFFYNIAKKLKQQMMCKSIKDLPRKGAGIDFHPLQEMENLYLTEKLEGIITMLLVSLFDKELFDDHYADLFEEEPNFRKFKFLFEAGAMAGVMVY